MSLSWARHTSSLNTTFILLSSDYTKSLHLQSDRSLEFHTPSGCHYTTRLPRYGRDLVYDRQSTEVLVPAVGVNQDGMGEVYRLNLELGRYMRSFEVDVGGDDFTSTGGGTLQGGINTGSVNTGAIAEQSHNLLAFGTSLGTVELWDPRAKGRAGVLSTPTQVGLHDERSEITALEFNRSGMSLGTGSSNGLIHLYDLRSPVPFQVKDQGYGFPIHTLQFLEQSSATQAATIEPKLLSADKRIIKLWDIEDQKPWTSVEPAVDLKSVAWCKDSGMLLTANEGRQQHSFFIPAPRRNGAHSWTTSLKRWLRIQMTPAHSSLLSLVLSGPVSRLCPVRRSPNGTPSSSRQAENPLIWPRTCSPERWYLTPRATKYRTLFITLSPGCSPTQKTPERRRWPKL